MSTTNELTIAPKAVPIMTPLARSTTFALNTHFLNSSSIVAVNPHRPHPEEAHRSRVYPRSAHQVRKSATADLRCAVSKTDGSVSLVAVIRDARKSALLRTRLIDASIGFEPRKRSAN